MINWEGLEHLIMGIDAIIIRYAYEDEGLGHFVIEDEYGAILTSGETLKEALENL